MGEGTIDPDELKRYSFAVWNFKMGEMVSLMIHIGDRLDLYKALKAPDRSRRPSLRRRPGSRSAGCLNG